MEVAPAGLSRVVASVFSAPGSGSPSPVEVAPAGLCHVAFIASVLGLTRFYIPPDDLGQTLSDLGRSCFFIPGWLRYDSIGHFYWVDVCFFQDFDSNCFDERFLSLFSFRN